MAHIERQDCHAWRTAQVDRRRTHTLSSRETWCSASMLCSRWARNMKPATRCATSSRPLDRGRWWQTDGSDRFPTPVRTVQNAPLISHVGTTVPTQEEAWRIECTSNGAIELDVTKRLLDHNCAWPQRLYRRSLTTDEQVRDPPVA